MKPLILITFLMCQLLNANGQSDETDDILTTGKKRNGVYMTFREFRLNKPSVEGIIKIKNNKISVLNERTGEFEKVKDLFWGACRNDTVYVLQKESWDASKPQVSPLKFIGRYCYFVQVGSNVAMNQGAAGVMHSYAREHVININNGVIYKLDNKLMRTILEKDPELLEEFDSNDAGRDDYEQFIILINERRIEDIKPVETIK